MSKILAGIILILAAVGIVWAVMSRNDVPTNKQEQAEMTEVPIAGTVVGVTDDNKLKFTVGESEHIAVITSETQIVKIVPIFGKRTEQPAELLEFIAGKQVIVWYMVEKNRPANVPLLELRASKIELQP